MHNQKVREYCHTGRYQCQLLSHSIADESPERSLKRTPESLYEPLDYVYEDKRLNVKEKRSEADNLYQPLDYVYEDKRLNVKEKKREVENLYEPLDYVYEGKRLNVKREVESKE